MVKIGKATILNVDCMEYMRTLPDKFFDLAIVDPPYGIGADEKQNQTAESRIKANGKSKAGRGYKLYKKTEWDNKIPDENYFIELFRISKNHIIWGGNYMTKFLQPSMGWIMWNKMQREFSLADGELAWTSFNMAIRIFDMSRGEAMANHHKNRFHPTQKPVKLYEWILTNYAKPGQTIFDSHMGSGSSAVACNNLGFEYVGCELDKDYYDAACKRVAHHHSQGKLF